MIDTADQYTNIKKNSDRRDVIREYISQSVGFMQRVPHLANRARDYDIQRVLNVLNGT